MAGRLFSSSLSPLVQLCVAVTEVFYKIIFIAIFNIHANLSRGKEDSQWNVYLPLVLIFSLFLASALISSFSTALRFTALVSETYTWQIRFHSSRRKRPPDCWEDIVLHRCPSSQSFVLLSFIGVEGEDSYGRQWIRLVGRVFRPSGR